MTPPPSTRNRNKTHSSAAPALHPWNAQRQTPATVAYTPCKEALQTCKGLGTSQSLTPLRALHAGICDSAQQAEEYVCVCRHVPKSGKARCTASLEDMPCVAPGMVAWSGVQRKPAATCNGGTRFLRPSARRRVTPSPSGDCHVILARHVVTPTPPPFKATRLRLALGRGVGRLARAFLHRGKPSPPSPPPTQPTGPP